MCTNRRPFKLYMQQDFLNFPRGDQWVELEIAAPTPVLPTEANPALCGMRQ